MPPAGFETASEPLQYHALDRAAPGIGKNVGLERKNCIELAVAEDRTQ